MPAKRPTRALLLVASGALLASILSGCGVGTVPLMPTPVLYTEVGLAPLAHIPEAERWTPRRVYYATTRKRTDHVQRIDYGNTETDEISMGLALIAFGPRYEQWRELVEASSTAERRSVVPLSLAGVIEAGSVLPGTSLDEAASPSQAGWVLEDMNDAIQDARSKDILIYVHGAKVNFYNACAYAAQLDHFTGRDMTSVAFSWPTRQNLFAYAVGNDVARGRRASDELATLIELLAGHTEARRIHIIAWSAGCRVLTDTYEILRNRYPDEPAEAIRERLRIGTAYFAAGDVSKSRFMEVIETIHDLSDRVIVTATDVDDALSSAARFMGGGQRIGQTAPSLDAEQVARVEALERFEAINVSLGADNRGFDITGHRYWFDHPWASSDLILSVRTDLTAAERGLVPGERDGETSPVLWAMPEDYPTRLGGLLMEIATERLAHPTRE